MKIENDSWVEKFRPKKINEIISQESIIKSLEGYIKQKNIPHLLFFGPSGCGKTSTILSLARELFTDKYFNERVIELNASDERGIKVIREKVKRYAQNSINIKDGIPNFKIIILDEADSMTPESQFALRKIMEDYSSVTRFCIICNYYQKIIDPLISRCSMIRFKPLKKDLILNKLKNICESENIKCSNDQLNKIVDISNGDLRKAINFIQRCNGFQEINDNVINNMSGLIDYGIMKKFILYAYNKDENKVVKYIEDFFINSYSLTNQIHQIVKIIEDIDINDNDKSSILMKIVDIDYKLNNGCDEYIQYYNLAYFIISLNS